MTYTYYCLSLPSAGACNSLFPIEGFRPHYTAKAKVPAKSPDPKTAWVSQLYLYRRKILRRNGLSGDLVLGAVFG